MARVSGAADTDQALQRFGAAIRAMRTELGVSQEALADRAGVDRSHMGKIERGERNVTMINILKIARALGVPAAELMRRAGL